jgi:hypothetical protein
VVSRHRGQQSHDRSQALVCRDDRVSWNSSFRDVFKVKVKGKGNVKFLQKNGKLGMVEEVYYIPKIKNNILSIGQLMKNEFEIFMKKRTLHLKDS